MGEVYQVDFVDGVLELCVKHWDFWMFSGLSWEEGGAQVRLCATVGGHVSLWSLGCVDLVAPSCCVTCGNLVSIGGVMDRPPLLYIRLDWLPH